MSYELTARALALSKQTSVTPQIILEIEGIPVIFGSDAILSIWRLDEGYFIDDGLRLDTMTEDENSRDYISLNKSTKNIKNQVTPDKSGTSSINSVTIELIDKDQELSRMFRFGENVEDMLSLDATVYFAFAGSEHPTDSIPIFRGYIDDYTSDNGSFKISIAHPENKKRSELFDQYQDALTSAINDSVTTIPVTSTASLIGEADILTTYIRIDDEYMLVNSFTATSLEVIRGQFGSQNVAHDIDAEVISVYRLQSQPLDMILKMYLSNSVVDKNSIEAFFGSESVQSINYIDVNNTIPNAICFGETNIEEKLGLIVEDTIWITGTASPVNDGSYVIKEFNSIDGIFYLVVDGALVDVVNDVVTANFKSQFNTIIGLGLTPREVDVQGHLDIDTFNPNQFESLDFRLEDSIEAKNFIDKEIMFPSMLYSINRKARISCKFVQPPLALADLKVIDETTILNIKDLSVKRSVNRFLYNQIVYKYEKLIGEDRFLRGKIIQNETSFNRIKAGKKQLLMKSLGLRVGATTESYIDRQSQRLFERYQFAAQQVDNVTVGYGTGVNIEVGDVVRFGSDNTQITDLSTGERKFKARLMEVINRSLNFQTGKIKLSLLETSYDLSSRYAVISLSSKTDTGSTVRELKIKNAYDSQDEYRNESDKWLPYIDQNIRIRNDDYTLDELAVLLQVKPSDETILVLKEDLSFIPGDNYIIEVPDYNDNGAVDEIYRDQFAYNVAQVEVTLVIDNISFEVDAPENLVVGSEIYVHSNDYTFDSFEEKVKIESIVGSVVTLDVALSFTPQLEDKIERSNFKDNAFPYLLI